MVSAIEISTYWITCQPMCSVAPCSIERWIIAAEMKAGTAMNMPIAIRRSIVILSPARSSAG